MSTRKGGTVRGAPKHQNRVVWKPNAGVKKNETEVGSKLRPFAAITGVCPRCKQQIEWRRKYGKYKQLTEPSKCNDCGKRAVRQAHHTLCTDCSKKRNVCAKCCKTTDTIIGGNVDQEAEERKQLEEALKTMRERDRRTLLRMMAAGGSVPKRLSKAVDGDEDSDDDEDEDDTSEADNDEDEEAAGKEVDEDEDEEDDEDDEEEEDEIDIENGDVAVNAKEERQIEDKLKSKNLSNSK